jgi:hypothetical protein
MRDDGRLLALALGTFHAVLLTLALVLLLFLTVDLGDALDGLSTPAGLAVFAALWATSVYCAHRGMRDAELRPGEAASAGRVLRNGETWGAWNGMLFFWCLLLAGTLLLLVSALGEGGTADSSSGYGSVAADGTTVEVSFGEEEGAGEAVVGVLVFSHIAFGIGTIASALAGATFGLVFALLDLQLLRAARWLAGVSDERFGAT